MKAKGANPEKCVSIREEREREGERERESPEPILTTKPERPQS